MIFLLCFTGTSGLTHYSMSLARELSRHAQTVLVTGRDYAGEGYPAMPFEVLPFFRRSRWYPLDLLRLLALLRARRPRVVVLQSCLKSPLVESMLARLLALAGIRVAMTVHDVLPHYPRPWSAWTHRRLYRAVDRLVVHSQRTLADVRALGVDTPALVVPHGVYDIFRTREPERAAARARRTPFAEGDFVVLFFGKVDVRKGIAGFLATRRALTGEPGYRFVIAGRNGLGPAQAALVQQVDEARAAPDCVVHDGNIGFLDVQDYFALADVVLMPYLEGTTSGVLKLALAFGKPVIATDVGDMAETLAHGIGALVPVASSGVQLAEAVRMVRAGYPEYQAACARAQAACGWPEIGRRYAEFLGASQGLRA